MSSSLITTGNESFQQTGQVDWESLSKISVSFGLGVLTRLSNAGLDAATAAIGRLACRRFVLKDVAQKRIHDAFSRLKTFSSSGKFIWFGFGIKPIINDLADTEAGLACVALCGCMSISYDSFFAAGVLRELFKVDGAPPGFLPSIHQWKALVDVCAGSVSDSKFPTLLEGLIRCVCPNADISLEKPTSTEALAKAIGALADVSNGKLENVIIAGGLDCVWLAAVSEWFLSLNIEIRRSSGFTVYKSSVNDGHQSPAVIIIFLSDNEHPIHISKCFIVPKGSKLLGNLSPEENTFRGGRSEWTSILADTFGSCFNTLLQEGTRQEFALLLLHVSRHTEACYRYGSMHNDAQPSFADYRVPFRRFHFAHPSSRGKGFLAFAARQLPELTETLDVVSQLEIQSHINGNLETCVDNITQKCVCQWCCSKSSILDPKPRPFCLELIAETIIMFLWMLSAAEVDSSLRPSSFGLRLLYIRHQEKSHFAKDIPEKKRGWKYALPANLVRLDIDILTAMMTIFTGAEDTGFVEDEKSSAVSRNGICAYFRALEDLESLPEEASTVKIISGHINFEETKYGRIHDLEEDMTVCEVELGPHPVYKLLVQETRQPGVMKAAYKVSCTIRSYAYLVGVSRLAKKIAESIRGPFQCRGLCSQKVPHRDIALFWKSSAREGNLSDLSEGAPLLSRQWSVISTQSLNMDSTPKIRVLQAILCRLYFEIVQQDYSSTLAFLSLCQDCSSIIPTPQVSGRMAASQSSKQVLYSRSDFRGILSVSSPSQSGSWMDREFGIVVTIPSADEQGISGIETRNAVDLLQKPRRNEMGLHGAVHIAASPGRHAMLQLLLEGRNTMHSTPVGVENALHRASENGQYELIDIIIAKGFQLECKDRDGLTPLSRAARRGIKPMVEFLIGYNANCNSYDNYGANALVEAARRGHIAVVEYLLQEKANVNTEAVGNSGRTALQAAAEGGHITLVEYLLQEKANVNAVAAEISGRTALQAAAGGGYIVVVERLLQEKANINAPAAVDGGRTALQAAAGGGHIAVVERLLQEKANVNAAAAAHNGRTALQAAAGGGHIAVVERLLQEKASISAAAGMYSGRTALQAAAEGGYVAVVERLLQEKANVNAAAAPDGGRTALQAAAGGGHIAVVERLLQEEVNVNAAAVKYNGGMALQAAAEGGHIAVVERLLQEKANVNIEVVGNYGRTALQAAAEGGHIAVVERLLQEKSNVNIEAVGSYGRTALQTAAGGGHIAVVERLLQEKANVNVVGHYGRTALQAAAEGGYIAIVERLIQEKADVNVVAAVNGGQTALQAAAEGGHIAVVERLLQEKACVNAEVVGSNGRTALQAAAGGGHIAVVKRLLQEKANVNAEAVGSYGRTALQAAAEGGYITIVELLLQEKANVNAAAAERGRTALQAAAEGGHIAVVELLLQKKANVNASAAADGGRTALQAAVVGGHKMVVVCLREAGAT